MRKHLFGICIAVLIASSAIAEDIVIDRTQLAGFLESAKSGAGYTPDYLCKYYNQNAVKFESDFKHVAFKIRGYITRIRRGFFDEYIVELKCDESWISDLAVVYPKKISEVKKKELANLNVGSYFEALVVGRSSWYYVDVPVWNQNGVYRTEP